MVGLSCCSSLAKLVSTVAFHSEEVSVFGLTSFSKDAHAATTSAGTAREYQVARKRYARGSNHDRTQRVSFSERDKFSAASEASSLRAGVLMSGVQGSRFEENRQGIKAHRYLVGVVVGALRIALYTAVWKITPACAVCAGANVVASSTIVRRSFTPEVASCTPLQPGDVLRQLCFVCLP